MKPFGSILQRGALALALTASLTAAASAAPFMLSSASVADGAKLGTDFGGPAECGGKNISPQLSWVNPPAGTASFAITIWDQDGQKGLGVSHWVAYGIPPSMLSLPAGAGAANSTMVVNGTNTRKAVAYLGPCPPVGDAPHHYYITVYATDLAPSALAAGLTREQFFAALAGHALGATTMVALYSR
jgi:Raf kinase inhibitor-like YbhB/YbcL family protein